MNNCRHIFNSHLKVISPTIPSIKDSCQFTLCYKFSLVHLGINSTTKNWIFDEIWNLGRAPKSLLKINRFALTLETEIATNTIIFSSLAWKKSIRMNFGIKQRILLFSSLLLTLHISAQSPSFQLSGNIESDRFLSADTTYYLNGNVYVKRSYSNDRERNHYQRIYRHDWKYAASYPRNYQNW